MAINYRTTTEFYLHTLLLLTLPTLIGSFQNLKQYQRWISYYGIWLQLMADTWAIENSTYIVLDITIFTYMEAVFQHRLKAITGGQSIPRSVYFSSWVSNTRLESYIAAHRSEENADDSEESSNEKQPTPNTTGTTTTTTSRSTTTATIKAKLGYLLATTVLLITVYQDIKAQYREYICRHSWDFLDLSYASTADYVTQNPNYPAYCFPTLSTFEMTLFDYSPSLYYHLYSFFYMPFTRLSALCFALAWSTIPTAVVVAAWTQMWNSPSSYRIRKVHYMVFMCPLKMAVLLSILYYTTDRREDIEGADYSASSLDDVRAKYLLVWFVLFRAVAKLAFGLGLIWNLYVAHSKDATVDRIPFSHQEERKEMEQLL
ncbi:hypothetical protein EC957_011310 [Mortierella hygrophila]|uniref:Uncharacterized protein n=1 Tax=Mortierella hygrophila TaxID=979708 RepID=A0A9P6F9Q4_9FUNG|nr:hypothetical protein EC957_011310 [Mortierella hygrophila]